MYTIYSPFITTEQHVVVGLYNLIQYCIQVRLIQLEDIDLYTYTWI